MSADARQVPVELGDRRYIIEIGADLLDRAGALCAPLMKGRRAIVVRWARSRSTMEVAMLPSWPRCRQAVTLHRCEVLMGGRAKR